ncbi:MAG: nucleoside hydrolase [Janthinobacterium lividum]
MLPSSSARLGAAAVLLILVGSSPAPAQEPPAEAPKTLVLMDNDFAGPGGTDMQAILPLLANPSVGILGLTVVTGDGWENDEAARLLRFLEIAGRSDVPVVNGATYPLLRSVPEMKVWERRYGKIPWKGAWGGLGSIDGVPAQEPSLPRLDEGLPTTPPAAGLAASFLIKQVHAHPHQVTVIAAGPLTDIALAIRMDPSFAADAKQLVFMGGLLDTSMASVTGNADFASDFNLIFDPEAAHIALTAPWPKIVAVGNVSNSVMMTRALMDGIASVKTPLTAYLSKYFNPLPLWDEMAAAIAVDPTLVTKSVDAFMDVDVSGGVTYGHAQVWPDATAPKEMGVRPVTIVQEIDTARFVDGFVKAAQWTPPAK